jgi:hypothetical protein
MNDIKAKMAGRKTGESNQSSVIRDRFAVATDREVRSETPESSEVPESRRDFVPQTAGGELVMREDCPELSHRGSAALGIQSACGGEAVQQRAEIRDQRSEKMTETPESASGFIPQATGGELHMPQDCPEFPNQADLAASGSPATSVTPPVIQSACGEEGKAPPSTQSACGGEDAEAPAIKIMSKIKIKTEGDFGNEVRVQEQWEEEAPAFGKDAETERPGDAERMGESKQSSVISDQFAAGESVGADPGSGGVRSEMSYKVTLCTPFANGGEDGSCPQISQMDADSGRNPAPQSKPCLNLRKSASFADKIPSDGEEMPETPESECDFVPQHAGAKLVMREECPKIRRGKGENEKMKIEIGGNAGNGNLLRFHVAKC